MLSNYIEMIKKHSLDPFCVNADDGFQVVFPVFTSNARNDGIQVGVWLVNDDVVITTAFFNHDANDFKTLYFNYSSSKDMLAGLSVFSTLSNTVKPDGLSVMSSFIEDILSIYQLSVSTTTANFNSVPALH